KSAVACVPTGPQLSYIFFRFIFLILLKIGKQREGTSTPAHEFIKEKKILRTNSPSFEAEFNTLMLASDQSDSEDDIDEFLVSTQLLQLHESDQDEDESTTIRIECMRHRR
ncbi:hypothetical protein HHI36_001522, partial [Cryptolaemus montrouzieri]